MAYRTLGKLRWQGKLPESRIVILHRGAPGDRKVVPGAVVTEVTKGHFLFAEREGETHIPYHRVREIWLGSRLLWKRQGSGV
ncbi:MAG: DUF504 domain-containing protein [Candidatus Aenigmarchaeota archaeon]|nr:DUF504 domain-containing protein [Candidatus Aenigmarchaeota archaeon]